MSKTYDLAFNELGITLRNPATGDLDHYLLREFDGTERDAYLNSITKIAKTNAKGEPMGVKNFDGLQAALIGQCMFNATRKTIKEAVGEEEGEEAVYEYAIDAEKGKVDLKWVQALPSHIGTDLFEECQKLCGLNNEAEDDAKNE